jgi:hypothetical protein
MTKDYMLSRKVGPNVPRDRWVASLSNGETIYEDETKGERPSWERLSEYCVDNDLSITNLRLNIVNTEVKLPSGKEGYIQKKVAWTLGGVIGGVRKCIGYAEKGLALIYEVDTQNGSKTLRTVDPGEPWTIYRADIRKARKNHATT